MQQAREAARAGDWGRVERLACEALSHDPQRAAAYSLLAAVRAKQGRHREGMDLLRAGLAVEPTDRVAQINLARLGSSPRRDPLLGDEQDDA
jgi:uncharacterized protein HemY